MTITTTHHIRRRHLRRIDQQQHALFDIARMWRNYEGDLDRATRKITETAANAMQIDRVSVWCYDRKRRVIRCRDMYEAGTQEHSSGIELGADLYPSYFTAMETQEVIAAENAITDHRTREFANTYLIPNNIGAMLDVPIRTGGQLAGVLCHEHLGGPRPFHIFEVNTATFLANMLAAAIEVQNRIDSELETKRSLTLLHAAFEASGFALMAVEVDGKLHAYNQRAVELWRIPPELLQDDSDPFDLMHHMAAQTSDPQHFNDRMLEIWENSDAEAHVIIEMNDGRILDCVSQPQQINGAVFGRVWSYRDVTEKYRLEQKLREQSVRDPLTGLLNRRGTEDALNKEITRARRTGKPFCVALLDIDHFKAINDTFDHDLGDRVLCSLAADLQQRMRATDYVGRWGGEEFLLVLPETTLDDARRLLEELRCHIARYRNGLPQITVSAGISECRSDMTADQVVAEADARMYEAKNAGRNRVAA